MLAVILFAMFLASFQYAGRIAWRIDEGDPPLFPVAQRSPWSLLNPLLYCRLPQPTNNHFVQFAPGKYFGLTSEIVLVTDDVDEIQKRKSADHIEDVLLDEKLRTKLRHLARQATIPSSAAFALGYYEIDQLPVRQPSILASDGYMVQKYWFSTAVTAEHLRAAAALGPDFVPPTHEVLLLDAIAGHRESDYRKAVLYAAMSAEVAFGSVVDEAYERIIASGNDVRFRIIGLPQPSGKSVNKDPIYEKLRGRSDFNILIHELSLYVLGRSLLVENEQLYQRAKRLYLTRNKLAHLGELPEGNASQLYTIDSNGSLAAIETTVALVEWLGEPGGFPLPGFSIARVKDLGS